MADHQATESSSKSNVSCGDSEETVQLNVKTLDSQIYSFCVDKNIPVSLFKEKIANEVGLPVERQRLIFRGKVLKDDHLLSEYHAEDGHTLHLVARQPTESSTEGSSGEATGNNSASVTDAANGPPRNRFGQVSHSVVLGTLNLGEQGNSGIPDLNRVIGAVLNSIGIGGQNSVMGTTTQPSMPVPQGNETGSAQGNVVGQDQSQNRAHGFQPQSATNIPQIFSIPMPAAAQPGPALNLPIPDSLSTIMEFINRMQLALSQDGDRTRETSNGETLPTTELPSTSFGLPTHRALSLVLRHTEQLLNNYVTGTISRAAERLDQDADLTDPARRGQLQSESMHLGLVMQHLGALFLELGRSTLLLRMGQSPGQSYVNAGPAVYISANGPNPIMAQPFPMQTSPLFSNSSTTSNPATFGPVGIGNAPRHVNIHIHAGTGLAPVIAAVGGRAGNADGTQGQQSISDAPGQTQATQVNTMGASMPASSMSQSVGSEARNRDLVAQINASLRSQPDRIENQSQSGQGAPLSSQMAPEVASLVRDQTSSAPSIPTDASDTKDKEIESVIDGASSSEKHGKADAGQAVPLGLGLGGLQAKKKVKQQKSQVKASDGESSSSNTRSIKMGEGASGQVDTANLMSQVIQSPALNGLLSGVSQQSGLGSPDVLRNMLTQFTQNPAMANVVNQIAQQVDDQDVGGMLSGMGGQGGGIDFSRMIQQMMPIVSQALGGVQPAVLQSPTLAGRIDSQSNQSSSTDDHRPQINVQRVAENMARGDAPSSIIRGMVENAIQLSNPGNDDLQLVEELCNDPCLTDEFMAMLHRDVSRRVENENDNQEEDS